MLLIKVGKRDDYKFQNLLKCSSQSKKNTIANNTWSNLPKR